MQKFKSLSDAIALAEFAHRNQLDKAGLAYIEHPKRVLAKVQAQGALPFVQIAAVFHDITEDTAFTPQMLLDLGFSEAAVRLVRLLDRGESKKTWDYIWKIRTNVVMDRDKVDGEWDYEGYDREKNILGIADPDEYYYRQIKTDRNATIIKLADIEDNLSPWRQVYLEKETQDRLKAKYDKALKILNPRPVNHGLIDPNYTYNPFQL